MRQLVMMICVPPPRANKSGFARNSKLLNKLEQQQGRQPQIHQHYGAGLRSLEGGGRGGVGRGGDHSHPSTRGRPPASGAAGEPLDQRQPIIDFDGASDESSSSRSFPLLGCRPRPHAKAPPTGHPNQASERPASRGRICLAGKVNSDFSLRQAE